MYPRYWSFMDNMHYKYLFLAVAPLLTLRHFFKIKSMCSFNVNDISNFSFIISFRGDCVLFSNHIILNLCL